jgi:hypothetical protein
MWAVLIEVVQRSEQSNHIIPDARISELAELLAVPLIGQSMSR